MKIKYNRGCSVCGCAENRKLFEQKFACIEKVTFIRGYDVVCCPECGFIYADGIPEQSELNKYYGELSKYEIAPVELSSFMRAYYESSLKFICSVMEAEGKTLEETELADIGCATGDFLLFLKDKGFTKLTGVDPSERCVAYLAEHGVSALRATIDEMPRGKRYGFLRLNTVLEHVEDLNRIIDRLSDAVEEEGYIYLAVPDILGFERLENCPFQEFSVEHINYFSPATLARLMGRHGFEPVAYREEGNSRFSELQAIYKKSSAGGIQAKGPDEAGILAIKGYIRKNEQREAQLNRKIKALAESGEPIVVWGVGTFTLRQLAQGELGRCRITCFADRNEHYQGQSYKGIPILPPGELTNDMGAILITAYYAQDDIGRYIREQLKLDNVILKDYL